MAISKDWIIEEGVILNRDKAVLNEIVSSLSTTTDEIDALISEIRDNLSKRQSAYSTQDWSAYHSLNALSFTLFNKLDWLVVNL